MLRIMTAILLTGIMLPVQAAPTVQVAQANGESALRQLVQRAASSGAFEAVVEKLETNLKDAKKSRVVMRVWGKKPHSVRVEVIDHHNPQTKGFKLFYTGGSANVRVQAGGALKFIKRDFPMTHPDIATANGYRLDAVDLYGLLNRLSRPGYTVQTTGDGVLEIRPKGKHPLDGRITRERLGFDPMTLQLRFWEAYTQGNTPFYQLNIQKMSFLNTLPDSQLKL